MVKIGDIVAMREDHGSCKKDTLLIVGRVHEGLVYASWSSDKWSIDTLSVPVDDVFEVTALGALLRTSRNGPIYEVVGVDYVSNPEKAQLRVMSDSPHASESTIDVYEIYSFVTDRTLRREKVYSILNGERDYQEERAKEFGWDPKHSTGDFLLMMGEYLDRARAAYCMPSGGHEKALDCLRKVTALGVACMEIHGAPRRKKVETYPNLSDEPFKFVVENMDVITTLITGKEVMELRERTGANFSVCKDALFRFKGDQDKAFEWLRKKGTASDE